jgi:dipeptidyl aminopeptidase/acylaminoacyl peptidase
MKLFAILLTLTLCCFAVPYASEQGANDGFILFTSDRDNPSPLGMCPNCEDIYVMSSDGTDPTRLTFGGGAASDPDAYNSGGADWSHSRKLIAFQSNRPIPESSLPPGSQLFLMNADGTETQPLILPEGMAGGSTFPSFSQTGTELCFQSQTMPRRDIYIVDVHGSGLTNLTSPGQAPGQLGQAGDNLRCDWSPKSNAIAFASNRHDLAGTPAANRNDEIYVMNADGSDVVRLTGGEGRLPAPGADVNPAWSPKGDRIAFESNRTGMPEIWVMNADGTDPVQLTSFTAGPTPSNVSVTKPTWSPKGDRIAFHRRVGAQGVRGHFEIYTMNADGTNVTQVTSTIAPGFSGFPSWGKWAER